MPIFRGQRQTLRGGKGAGRGDNAHYQANSEYEQADVNTFGTPSLNMGRVWNSQKNKSPNDVGTKWSGADKMTFGDETPDTMNDSSRLGAGGKLLPGMSPFGSEHDFK
jgi:hypothetical protein